MKDRFKTTQKTAQKILEALSKKPDLSRNDLARIVGRTPDAVKQQLAKLKAAAAIRRVGPDKGGHWEVIQK